MTAVEPAASEFFASPEILRPSDSLLLVIDAQERLVPAMHDAAGLARNIGMLVQGAGLVQVPVVVSEQYPKGLGATVPGLLPVGVGDAASDATPALPAVQKFEKTIFSVARVPELLEAIQLSGATQLIVCGMEAHVCVTQSVLDLLANLDEVVVYVVEDAVSSRTLANRDAGLRRMAQAGARVVTTEMVLFDWIGGAKHVAFKSISALVK